MALLTDRVAVVTGGANGIGAAVVARLASEGAIGVVCDLEPASERLPARWQNIVTDVADEDSLAQAFEQVSGLFGSVDVIVPAAGIVPSWADLESQTIAVWDEVLNVNARGVMLTIKRGRRLMKHGGAVVAIASTNAWRGDANIVSYVASKHAVLGIVRSAALDLGRSGIRVNAVAPGHIATEALLTRMRRRQEELGIRADAALEQAKRQTALGRIATVDEVAAAVLFLASDLSSGVTGHMLSVDAGLQVKRGDALHDRLDGKVVLLTGASRGIGAATAQVLGADGAYLIGHYGSNLEGAEAACAAIPEARKLILQADLARPGAARDLWQRALAWRDQIDVLVLNAAIALPTPIAASDQEWDDAWDEMLRVNVTEPASLVREALTHFIERQSGTLITLSSWAAQRGSAIPQLPAYAATKAAIKAFTQTIAHTHARDGVLAYIIAPGIVKTEMSEISAIARGGVDAVNAVLAMGEMVDPEEIGRLVSFLASGAARHLTGATLDINGATYIR